MKGRIILFMLLASVSFLLGFFINYMRNNDLSDGVNCLAQMQYDYEINHSTTVLKTGILFNLAKSHGVVSYSGKLSDGGNSYRIKRYAEVIYSVRNENTFFLKTKKLKVSSDDDLPERLAQKYLYSYLREDGGWISLGIHKNAGNGYIISTTNVPQMFCKQVK